MSNPCDQFEQWINDGSMQFRPASLADLTPWGQLLVQTFLQDIPWRLGDKRVGESCCLQLDDPYLHYLDVLEETNQFLWAGEGHHDSIHPDDASAYLTMRAQPGTSVTCVRTNGLRRMVIKKPGFSITIDDPRG